ncbi:MAG: hypothetical protein AAF960_29065, partial [Bacteroidota bacterium]
MRFKNLHTSRMTILCPNASVWKSFLFLFFTFSISILQAQSSCDNLTDGGAISGNESGCNSPTFDPSPILSTALPSGGSGDIEYLWMRTTGDPNSPFNTWQIIPGANGPSYDPTPISQTTYYGRCSRRSGCTEYVGETNVITKAISCCNLNIAINPTNSTVCPGESLALSVTGADTSFTYSWTTTGGTFNDSTFATPTYTMMMLGTYTISVTITKDDCVEMAETVVTVDNQLSVTITSNTTTANINDTIQLGTNLTGNNTYAWSALGGTLSDTTIANPTFSATTGGTYQIYLTATNADGCSGTDTLDVTIQDCGFAIIGIAADASCSGGNDGSITLSTLDAMGTVAYTWNDISIGNNNNPTNLAPGTYSVTATDGAGCEDIASFTIGRASDFTISAATQLLTCVGINDGQILITITGGTSPFTYNWSDGLPDTNLVNNLSAGQYGLTVTDAGGCMQTASYELSEPVPLRLAVSVDDPDCGLSNGSATVTVTGGAPDYTYAWNDANSQTTPSATNLAGGDYQVVVTDDNGCQDSAAVTLSFADTSTVVVGRTIINATCGRADGAITLMPTGGTAPYTYAWDGGLDALPSQTGLVAGVYNFTITDAGGCGKAESIIVGDEGVITINFVVDSVSCFGGNDGGLIAVATGGIGGYTYAWTNRVTTSPLLMNLTADTYTVTATDSIGCTADATITLTEPSLLETNVSASTDSCSATVGSATVNVAGGTPNYTYLWNDSLGQTTPTATNLPTGTYTVTVMDAKGCTQIDSIELALNQGLVVTLNPTPSGCAGENSGTITTSVANGVAPFNYQWNNSLGNFPGFTGLAQGIYQVTVTDANGCFGTASAKVHTADSLIVSPVVDSASCTADDGRARLDVSGGTPPYNYNWGAPLNTNTQIVTGLASGSYNYTITDANGCTYIDSILVNRETNCDTCQVVGGVISTSDSTTICAGDNVADDIMVALSGNMGDSSQWVVTDTALNILELPNGNVFNFDGAGFGSCLIWHLSYEGTVGGLVVGQNAANLSGCFDLSNSILVIRRDCSTDTCMVDGGVISTADTTTICAGDGVADDITVALSGNMGDSSQWVVTDTA